MRLLFLRDSVSMHTCTILYIQRVCVPTVLVIINRLAGIASITLFFPQFCNSITNSYMTSHHFRQQRNQQLGNNLESTMAITGQSIALYVLVFISLVTKVGHFFLPLYTDFRQKWKVPWLFMFMINIKCDKQLKHRSKIQCH